MPGAVPSSNCQKSSRCTSWQKSTTKAQGSMHCRMCWRYETWYETWLWKKLGRLFSHHFPGFLSLFPHAHFAVVSLNSSHQISTSYRYAPHPLPESTLALCPPLLQNQEISQDLPPSLASAVSDASGTLMENPIDRVAPIGREAQYRQVQKQLLTDVTSVRARQKEKVRERLCT
jgi:hypothetical protein